MEYGNFLNFLMPYLPETNNTDFINYIADNPNLLFQIADLLMYNLPTPRYSYYEHKNFEKIQKDVTTESNKFMTALGYYQPRAYMKLLETMELLSQATLLLGLIFNIVVLLFIVISVLLIYSLLMISVETKSFENGVLRLVGLRRSDCVQMILV